MAVLQNTSVTGTLNISGALTATSISASNFSGLPASAFVPSISADLGPNGSNIRVKGTTYQNTTGRTLSIQIVLNCSTVGTRTAFVNQDFNAVNNGTATVVYSESAEGSRVLTVHFYVPAGHYYKITSDASETIGHWYEYELVGAGGDTILAANNTFTAVNTFNNNFITASVGITGSTARFTAVSASSLFISSSGNAIIDVSSSSSALRITQRGTGESIRVEDELNPDSTPFIVDASGNVGIGLIPTQKLQVNGNISITGTGKLAAGFGSTNTASISFSPTENTGLSSPSANVIGIITNGTERMRITSGGNVGIGKSVPNSVVDVLGNTIISGNLNVTGTLSASSITANGANLTNIPASAVTDVVTTNTTQTISGGKTFTANNSFTGASNTFSGASVTFSGVTGISGTIARFTTVTASNGLINGDLRVLGTASIGQLNTINQTSLVVGDKYVTILSGGVDHTGINGSGFLWGTSSGPGETTGALGEHAHILYDASRDALEIFPGLYVTGNTTVNGNVGIGTTSPQTKLHVSGTGEILRLQTSEVSGNNYVLWTDPNRLKGYVGYGSSGADDQLSLVNYSGTLTFGTNNTIRATIDTSGNLGIGTTSPTSLLHVDGNALVTGDLAVNGGNITSNAATLNIFPVTSINLQKATTIQGTLSGTGNFTTAGDLDVNGGDLRTTAATFNLLPNNATIVNFANAASLMNIGNIFTSNEFDFQGNGQTNVRIYNYTASIVDGQSIADFKVVSQATLAGADGSRGIIRTLYDGVSGAAEVRILAGTENNTNVASIAGFSARSGITFYRDVLFANSGDGINFANKTPNAATGTLGVVGSEILDDYERGTWTPGIEGASVAGVPTYSTRSGDYVKIGNLVFIRANVTWTAHTGTGQIEVVGLPFSCADDSPLTLYCYDLTYTAGASLSAIALSATSIVKLYESTSGGNQAASSLDMDTAATIIIGGCYRTLS